MIVFDPNFFSSRPMCFVYMELYRSKKIAFSKVPSPHASKYASTRPSKQWRWPLQAGFQSIFREDSAERNAGVEGIEEERRKEGKERKERKLLVIYFDW